MSIKNKFQNRIDNQTKLLFNFAYASSVLSFVLAFVVIYALDITGHIPLFFFLFAILNLTNIFLFKIHGNPLIGAFTSSSLSLICVVGICIFSGAINSPFIFVLSIIILGGYISGRFFGKAYLVLVLLIIAGLYAVSEFTIVSNEVPEESKDTFSLLSLLFCIYLLIGVFGKHLLRTHSILKQSKNEIETGITEKEMLLRTVHHRVKNNLQTVSSLLSLQSKNTSNEKIKELAKSSQYRINSMAIIHEMLYMRDNISKIAFRPYVRELTEFLIKSANDKNLDIKVNIDMPDVSLGLDTTIPLGLLINEAVTNSLKYGFPENSVGEISILLKEDEKESQSYFLDIIDDGVGFPKSIDHKTTNSLGLKLMHNLGRQLRGSVSRMTTDKGTGYHIIFKDRERHFTGING
ncbi:sensor histidine kinase [Zobellia galactanivorans]|uniref:histidine kinase n=1 Tax=Zobellia galactanivorans (strain DSM 12802 / CCUG 47099 / CIP 106680 / NCIMB 13871 / Dsij) TaxID=63186 RepID=G0LCP9_ZOBGA|nr:sensor histidine kinase [Zobellia galactanivorans]CAZ97087.1 Two-component system-Sensor histidine kinase [Zobellia galactanivorans]